MLEEIREILDEIELVDPDSVPQLDVPVAKGEVDLGVMPPWLKKVYAVYYAMSEALTQECAETHAQLAELASIHGEQSPEFLELEKSHHAAHAKHKVVQSIFWYELQKVFRPVKDHDNLGVRQGCHVVSFNEEQPAGRVNVRAVPIPPGMLGMLGGLPGMGGPRGGVDRRKPYAS